MIKIHLRYVKICINIHSFKNTVTDTKRSQKGMFSGCLLSTDSVPGAPTVANYSPREALQKADSIFHSESIKKFLAHSHGGQFNPSTCMPMSLTMTLFRSTNSILLQLA